jgi:plastocyanin
MPSISFPMTWRSAPRIFGGASAAAALLAVSACGATENNSGSSGTPGGTAVTVSAKEYAFTPAQFSVPAGATVTVTFHNQGTVEHSFTLNNGGGEVEADAGSTKSVTFTAPQSGTLAFHCKYHPTQMMGNITVGGGGAGAGGTTSSGSSSSSSSGNGYGY